MEVWWPSETFEVCIFAKGKGVVRHAGQEATLSRGAQVSILGTSEGVCSTVCWGRLTARVLQSHGWNVHLASASYSLCDVG